MSRLDSRMFVGATFGSLTVLAIDSESPRGAICACSKYGGTGRVLVKCLLSGHTSSGKRFPGLRIQPGIIIDEETRLLLPPESKWRIDSSAVYASGWVQGEKVRLHRLVYQLHHGPIPEGKQVDHRDGNKLNNSISNLRLASPVQNSQNVGLSPLNTSGFKGVSWNKIYQKWEAQIKFHGRKQFLGYYDTLEEAKAVVEAKREELHGEFANHG